MCVGEGDVWGEIMHGGIDGERVDIGEIVIMFVCSYDKKWPYCC